MRSADRRVLADCRVGRCRKGSRHGTLPATSRERSAASAGCPDRHQALRAQELQQLLDAGADDFLFYPQEQQWLTARMMVAAKRVFYRGELAKTEEQLRASNERFRLAVSGANDGLWDAIVVGNEWHNPQTPVWFSPRCKDLLGFSDEELPNLLGSWESRLHPDDHPRIIEALTDHLVHRKPYDVEYRLRKKSGEYGWYSARAGHLGCQRHTRADGGFNSRHLAGEEKRG